MLAYASISTLWRPISRDQFLLYKLSDVLKELGLSRAQLTALAIVSSNDYNKNIYSLDPTTNYSIIKALPSQDPREIVSSYLSDKTMVCKNDKSQDFVLSIRVFADMKQTPVHTDPDSLPSLQTHEHLRDRFQQVCTKYGEKKTQRQGNQEQSNSTKDEIIRLHSSKTQNRFKTVESPAPLTRILARHPCKTLKPPYNSPSHPQNHNRRSILH
ncbi:hypothetical protein BGX34_002874 [Mortierella sp. NVP85]|nr:hypothetical protein BGX34_002874 [Mortierella sp. NVP85]